MSNLDDMIAVEFKDGFPKSADELLKFVRLFDAHVDGSEDKGVITLTHTDNWRCGQDLTPTRYEMVGDKANLSQPHFDVNGKFCGWVTSGSADVKTLNDLKYSSWKKNDDNMQLNERTLHLGNGIKQVTWHLLRGLDVCLWLLNYDDFKRVTEFAEGIISERDNQSSEPALSDDYVPSDDELAYVPDDEIWDMIFYRLGNN